MANLECRFYENEFPKVGDLVKVTIISVDTLGSNVKLLEYNNMEGFVPSSEYSRTRVRSVARLMKVGQEDILEVTGVDEENGYIDLSKKFVTSEDKEKCHRKYKKSLQVHGIMRRLAEIYHKDLKKLYEEFVWKMYKEYGHAYDAFKTALKDPKILDNFNIEPIDLKNKLLETIKHRLASKPVKFEAEIDLTCFSIEGVDAIKSSLKTALKINEPILKELKEKQEKEKQQQKQQDNQSSQDNSSKQSKKKKKKKKKKKNKQAETVGIISITLQASPTYSISTVHLDKEVAIDRINQTIQLIKNKIESSGGKLVVKTPPSKVTK